ncbi:hypothetical protein WL74_29385 [Burkholderia cepacia]|uniref:cytochrome P450 n=1 Tax=Burkholderia cepacia TaxID=292 RepID=UPI00075FA026|nr:cytochrome P450 [Burkholderia cepacia]KWE18348.1 hypothetical protein WL74_29385 [Burkholderia cepacia]
MKLDNIDEALSNPATYADFDGYHALLRQLRAHDPVHWTEPEGYAPFWTVTRFQDVQDIERQNELFVNAPRSILRPLVMEESFSKTTGSRQTARGIIQMDGDEHRKHRLLTQGWFSPAKLKFIEDTIVQLARQHVDSMTSRQEGFDFAHDLSAWFPLQVQAIILGAPVEDAPFILEKTQQHFGYHQSGASQDPTRDAAAPMRELFDYFNDQVAERRRNPREDLFTLLADAKVDGEPISDLIRNSYFFLVTVGGHDTTSSLISGLLWALVHHPDQLARLRAEAALLPGAIEEALRWICPVKGMFRTAVRDTVVGGQSIQAGDSLLLSYPSATRDDAAYEAPDEFRIDRDPNRHLAFGFGVHVCLGQHLARMETRLLYRELLSRVYDIQLTGEPAWQPSTFVSGLKSLPIRYRMTPASV